VTFALRRTVGAWAGGTRLIVRREVGGVLIVSPASRPAVDLEVDVGDVVHLRGRVVALPEPAAVEAPPAREGSPRAPDAPAKRRRRRRPVVVATARALEQAASLLPGRVLENVVTGAILASRMRFDRQLGQDGQVVDLGGGVFALVRRDQPSVLQTRRAWRVVGLRVEESSRAAPGGPPAGHRSSSAAVTLRGEPSPPIVARTAPDGEVTPRDAE
jgi:hypothetical protein